MDENARPKHAGNALLEHVKAVLREYGYVEMFIKPNRDPNVFLMRHKKSFITNYRYGIDIYRVKRLNHIILYNEEKYPGLLIIDCRWQATSGSVDQKYPFIVHSLKVVHNDTALILDGEGMRPEAIAWAKDQKENNHLIFESLGEFSRWTRLNL